MNLNRWLQFGAVLVVAFLLSVGAGVWLGRQRTGPPVANVPTPSPAATALSTASLPPTPSPTLTVSPTVAPTFTPSPGPPTVPPTLPPSPSPASPPALDPPTAEDFADALQALFRSGDTQYLADRLHPLVFERYGEGQCRDYVSGFEADPKTVWTVMSSSGPDPWAWETDGLTTIVTDAWTVVVEIPDNGQRDVHFAPFDGTWRWFVDCGDPR